MQATNQASLEQAADDLEAALELAKAEITRLRQLVAQTSRPVVIAPAMVDADCCVQAELNLASWLDAVREHQGIWGMMSAPDAIRRGEHRHPAAPEPEPVQSYSTAIFHPIPKRE